MTPSGFLTSLFNTAVDHAQPSRCVPRFIPPFPNGRTIVVGAGKAGAAMALAFEQNWHAPLSGTVLTRYGFSKPCERLNIVEASHPLPDMAGIHGTQKILEGLKGLGHDDLVVVLLSGGASALLTNPANGLSLEDKIACNRALLQSGAPISVVNCIRKHLSAIKGGHLALAAQPAQVITLAISDVPHDDPSVIGSGPTVPDPTTLVQAREYVEAYRIALPDAALRRLQDDTAETPKPGHIAFENCSYRLIATPDGALKAAAEDAKAAGFKVTILGSHLEGEAQEVAKEHAAQAMRASPGTLFLSGGELTVTKPGSGRGGPNTEYALALAIALQGAGNIFALAGDTDGIDGTEDNAGALVDSKTLADANRVGISAEDYLKSHDSYLFFKSVGRLLMTGPTHTNVNDFRAILVT